MSPASYPPSQRVPNPSAVRSPVIGPGQGRKAPPAGSSALTRTSMEQPSSAMSDCENGNGSPAAIRNCCSTRSMPVTISVTGCSTCSRVFISR